ncbi:MAG: hypothetical protein IJ062_09335 [Firmicutes bacterium]|nr:hypothetical protein [Bacillota bacterium]
MGLSGLILRKYEKLEVETTKKTLLNILDLCGCKYTSEFHTYSIRNRLYNYYFISVSPQIHNKNFVMYLYGDVVPEYNRNNFEFIESDLVKVVSIEDIYGCEEILLKILHEYFKFYPDDFFYNELEWYYDKNIISKIIASSDQKNWCYIKPYK